MTKLIPYSYEHMMKLVREINEDSKKQNQGVS